MQASNIPELARLAVEGVAGRARLLPSASGEEVCVCTGVLGEGAKSRLLGSVSRIKGTWISVMIALEASSFALRRSLLLPCGLRHGRFVRIEGCFAPGKVNVSSAAGLEVVCNKLRCPETGCAACETKCSLGRTEVRICTTGMMRLYTVAASVVRPELLLQSGDGETPIRLRDLRLRADAVSCQPEQRNEQRHTAGSRSTSRCHAPQRGIAPCTTSSSALLHRTIGTHNALYLGRENFQLR